MFVITDEFAVDILYYNCMVFIAEAGSSAPGEASVFNTIVGWLCQASYAVSKILSIEPLHFALRRVYHYWPSQHTRQHNQ
jgi:hypothetical protein